MASGSREVVNGDAARQSPDLRALAIGQSFPRRNGSAPMPAESTTCVRRLDELYTAYPFLGSRRMTAVLRAEELSINRKRVHSG
jgi:hypothetical protein